MIPILTKCVHAWKIIEIDTNPTFTDSLPPLFLSYVAIETISFHEFLFSKHDS